MIEERLIKKLLTVLKPMNSQIISICGAADLGKTFLANRIAKKLDSKGISCSHLTLDSFLKDRDERRKKGWSGYQLESHNIELILETLQTWQEKKSIQYRPYCHRLGIKEKEYKQLESSDILLIEGLFSMHELLMPFVSYSIFLFTSDEDLIKIRKEADLIKRNYTKEYSDRISQSEFNFYKKNVAPFKAIADCKVFLTKKWNYIIIN